MGELHAASVVSYEQAGFSAHLFPKINRELVRFFPIVVCIFYYPTAFNSADDCIV